MNRILLPAAAGLLAFGLCLPALADGEGTYAPREVASPASGPAAPGLTRFGPTDEQYNDGTHAAVPEAPAPAQPHARVGGLPAGTLYDDGTQGQS